MQRLFSTFPDGSPGIGLLLLRAGASGALIAHAAACLTSRHAASWGTWAVGVMAVLTGAVLLVGLMTPFAGVLAALGSAGVALSWFPSPVPSTSGARAVDLLLMVVTAAIALLGPGAISVDAALFGRREITIPPRPDAVRVD